MEAASGGYYEVGKVLINKVRGIGSCSNKTCALCLLVCVCVCVVGMSMYMLYM